MSSLYKDKYEILKTFKEDEYQTVLIGSDKENLDEVVVINILHKNKIPKPISESKVSNGLNNLLYLENVGDDLIIVTQYKEGTPFESYLKFFDNTIKHKINLAYEYLDKITKYDAFDNSIKKILIDESQMIIKGEELCFNELLFLDNNFENPTEFNDIASHIGDTIEKIVFSKEPIDDKDNYPASQSLLEIINKLKNNDHEFKSIQDICNSFKKIFIYDLFMENESKGDEYKSDAKEKNGPIDNEMLSKVDFDKVFIDKEKEKEQNKSKNNGEQKQKRFGNISKVAIGILLCAALIYGAFALSSRNSIEKIHKPEAHFTYEKIADSYNVTNESKIYGKDNEIVETLWQIYKGDRLIKEINNKKNLKIRFEVEGKYEIVLNIKDKNGNTDDYREEIIYNNQIEIDRLNGNGDSEEKLDGLSLTYPDSSIAKDYNAFRSGDYSLKLGEEGKANSEKITIDNLDIENNPSISMWIASSSKESINILIKGYKDDNLRFSKSIEFIPQKINAWEMVETNQTAKDIDKIELIFKDFTSPIWLDDIEVNSYK